MLTPREAAIVRELPRVAALVLESAARLRRLGDRPSRTGGLSAVRRQVLGSLLEAGRSVPRIATALGVTRQSVQRVADELVAGGLASFQPNPRHLRSPLLVPTPRGRELIVGGAEAAQVIDLRLGSAIGEPDLPPLIAALERLLASLRELEGSAAQAAGSLDPSAGAPS